MIIYKDILLKLKEAGYSSYRLRKEKILTESTITRLRNNQVINTDTLALICKLTGLAVHELIEYRPE